MASNPLFIILDFFCIFPMNFAMATLGFKEMGKFPWKGREKSLPTWLVFYFGVRRHASFPQKPVKAII